MEATPTTASALDAPLAPASCASTDAAWATKPNVSAFTFIGGTKGAWTGKCTDVTSPIYDAATGKRAIIGSLPDMEPADVRK